MPDWNPKTEALIRELGDFIDTQLRDVCDPKASSLGTSARVIFNVKSKGVPLFQRAERELGLDLRNDWEGSLKSLVAICEQNGSDAGAKIKGTIPVAKQLADEFGFGLHSAPPGKMEAIRILKQIKKKGIKF